MTMVPGSAILNCLETICEVLSRSNWTLSDSSRISAHGCFLIITLELLYSPIHAIHIHGLVLTDSMPMNAGTVFGHVVDHCDVQGLGKSARYIYDA